MSFTVPQEPARPYDDDDDNETCPRCRRGDRLLYVPEYAEWWCTRCGVPWRVDPRDPRVS